MSAVIRIVECRSSGFEAGHGHRAHLRAGGGSIRAVEGPFVNVVRHGGGPYACPCCGYLTLDGRGGYEICPVCLWEDDGQGDHDADRVRADRTAI